MKKLYISGFVGVGALVLSTLAIQAGDLLRGIDTNLSGLAIESEGVCGPGATQLLLGDRALCIDVYEASASAQCPVSDPRNPAETQQNANEFACGPQSVSGAIPWRFVSLTQAQQLCARVGKRLPTNEEWYRAASGLADDTSCVVDGSSAGQTGTSNCVTPSGVHDMIGNVWEWVDEQVVDGVYDGRALPPDGYVALVDTEGVAIETSRDASEEFGKDYAWTSESGVRGMLRGGFYGSGEDAGIYIQNMEVPLDHKTAGVGFRCVKDI